ncbi:MAG: helix-turn-helix transcriptional regulator, partial [Candidatus Aminicenantes bacterium]|nr:helix-turn-helix transcriptional regulator [Candidatus Aminicenantes bacterium]
MSVFSFVIYILAFVSGFVIIALGNALQRRFRIRYIFDYFIYLSAAVIYGFFNWIGPFLVTELGGGFEERSIFLAVFIFGALGIPVLFVKIYFLFALVIRWMEQRISRVIQVLFGILGLVTITLYLMDTRRFILFDTLPPLFGNIFWIGVFSVGIQLLILLLPFLTRKTASPALKSLRVFCIINLVCYGIYTTIAYTGSFHMTPLFYYLLLLPPLIFVRRDLKRNPPPHLTGHPPGKIAAFDKYALTPREREIVDLVLLGHNNRQIGKTLFLSVQSVKNALTRIYRKTSVPSRSALISRVT